MLPDDSSSSHHRTLYLLLALSTSFLIFISSERCFDNADHRNAITMVQTLRAKPGAMTIPDAIVLRHDGVKQSEILWHAALTDKYYGFVRVAARFTSKGQPVEYLFDVNLSGQRLHPANVLAREVMGALGDDTQPPATN